MAQEKRLKAGNPMPLPDAFPTANGEANGRSLLLVSNREPYRVMRDDKGKVRRCVTSMGGLTSGLIPVIKQFHGVWMCWDPRPQTPGNSGSVRKIEDDGVPFPMLLVGLRESEFHGYYNGFCNRVLWPLCHSMLRRVSPRLDYWLHFRTVNERFADAIARHAGPRDVVWLHDYHLMLVPAALRRRAGTQQSIGYFHHIPFPKASILKTLPWHRQLLSGLLGADAIAFHTADYAAHFIESCAELLGCDTVTDPGTVIHGQRRTLVRARPIGLEATMFERLATENAVKRDALRIRQQLDCDCLVLSVDRLDYTKGLLERVHAIRALLRRLPQCRGIVTFLQIAVPTRTGISEYQQYRARFEAAVRDVNEEFGTAVWQPLICRTEALTRRELVSHYLAADVAAVTPLADGLNLVALEYCATRTNNDGVLVLSRQAGAVSMLGDNAVTVDATDPESMVQGLIRALTMPVDERRRRMTGLRELVLDATSEKWARRCLRDIQSRSLIETPSTASGRTT
jgi:alpha,alpha-trehalose-phosphate synthase [UDP-forming]